MLVLTKTSVVWVASLEIALVSLCPQSVCHAFLFLSVCLCPQSAYLQIGVMLLETNNT